MAHVSVTSSEFADGRRNEVASPESEQIEPAGAKPHRQNSVSVEQIQDRLRRTAFSVLIAFLRLSCLRAITNYFNELIALSPYRLINFY